MKRLVLIVLVLVIKTFQSNISQCLAVNWSTSFRIGEDPYRGSQETDAKSEETEKRGTCQISWGLLRRFQKRGNGLK